MKDHRFIELVNLYIDRQITAAETEELEAEIQSNPHRRTIYRQYCQMHCATKLLHDGFRTRASGQQPATRNPFEGGKHHHTRSRWFYYTGGLAAAACLALAFVHINSQQTTAASLMANLSPHAHPSVQAVVAEPPAVAAAAPTDMPANEPHPGLVSLRTGTTTETDYAALLTALRREEQRAFANGQIQSNQMRSLFDDGVFESQQFSSANNQRVFRGQQAPAQQAEFTAFQFQR